MNDGKRDELILFLLRVWFRFDSGLQWPRVKRWVEDQLNELLPNESDR